MACHNQWRKYTFVNKDHNSLVNLIPLIPIFRRFLGGMELEHWFKISNITPWKIFRLGVFLARIFLHSDWIQRDTQSIFFLFDGISSVNYHETIKFFMSCNCYHLLNYFWPMIPILHPLYISLRGNLVCILCISSERIGTF